MKLTHRLALAAAMLTACSTVAAQTFRTDNLKRAADVLGLNLASSQLPPGETLQLTARDGRRVSLRTTADCTVEHIGVPMFGDLTRLLLPSPVYDFIEFAAINWKYKVTPNQYYLSRVIFKKGDWNTLLEARLDTCDCSISNQDNRLYIVSWQSAERDVAVIGIPIDYELLNNDTRRNMERTFVRELQAFTPATTERRPAVVDEASLSIYGTEGLFVAPGPSYLIDQLNQNVYYLLTTTFVEADTVVDGRTISFLSEAVCPVPVASQDFPDESFANLLMSEDGMLPDATIELDIHLSNYRRQKLTMPVSKLKSYCQRQGCDLYFASTGRQNDQVRGMMIMSNLGRGYDHLLSLRMPASQLTADNPTMRADVYLYIPPIDKSKLFSAPPSQKSGANFSLP